MKKIGILGSTGKMGSALLALPPRPGIQLVPLSRKDPSYEDLHVLIDFSHPDAAKYILERALTHKLPIVIGTTGLTDPIFRLIETASLHIPILYSANFSLGIALIKEFITHHLEFLTASYIDIFETHHTEKKDLPSGTSFSLASIFKDKTLKLSSPVKREESDLVIHANRLPTQLCSHTIQFTFKEEALSLHHEVMDRTVYAKGAVVAAEFLLHQKPGLYSFSHVFAT